jgi:alkanesulfonate monooxygenase SsuD/methylene tetrahydromethanopterin reductase-like flavin-dependent oxidoreductase (luciferase family)
MKRLWTEERVSLDGRFFTLRDAVLEPKPTQKPHPPLWFGGRHPNALKRAVELGSGFIGGGASSTVRFGEAVRLLEPLLAAARRGPADFRVGKRVYVAIDHDRARAGRRLAEWFATFYGRAEMAADVAVFGGEQECLDGLAEVLRGGATFLILNPVFDELEHLERLAADIVPKL